MLKLLSIALLLAIVAVGGIVLGRLTMNHNPPQPLAASRPASDAKPKQLWTCGMHPQVVQDHPGNCPICHMKLTPMRNGIDEDSTGEASGRVVIDPAVVQNMGIRTAEVTSGRLVGAVRAVGVLVAPETGLYDVSPKVGGWITKLYANQEGLHVMKGDPLFDLYSPELVVAQEELLAALKSASATAGSNDPSLITSSQALVESAKRKLRLLDIADDDINSIAHKMVAQRVVTFRSPASGVVVDKAVVEGSATQPGQKLMRIEDHGRLWLELQLFENQWPQVSVGQKVHATFQALPGESFEGQITFVHPHVDPASRTVTARAVFDNPSSKLRPGMYASAVISVDSGEDAVLVPREAVIDTGTRQLVFVATYDGHFEPRTVHVGRTGEAGRVEIIDGLSPGERVVTSGQFLLDVESRTTEAIENLRAAPTTAAATSAPAAVDDAGERP